MEAELRKLNPWWEGKPFESGILREIYLQQINKNLESKEILFLTGLRRTGKTTIMYQAIAKLIKKMRSEDILFIRVDSFPLLEHSIHEMIEEYRRIFKKGTKDFFYLFLDEVSSRNNFEQELKSLYDNDNIKMICSSSIATLMRDKKALLTGRTITIEVMPLTFEEFLLFRDVVIKGADRALLEGHFRDYLRLGGIPHYVLTEDENYLHDLIQSIIYKDIVAYYGITNERVVKELFLLLCERVGKSLSLNKLSNILGIGINTLRRYVGYFEKAYLFYIVDRHTRSYNERITSPKKIYIGDVGIKNMVTGFRDLGASYENLVFLRIKHLHPGYYREGLAEIDFITKDLAIEAKYNQKMDDKQKNVFENIKGRKKIIAEGVDFFRDWN